MEEEWKDIEGYEGRYQISNLGNVMSLLGLSPRLLKLRTGGRGYSYNRMRVLLYKGGKGKTKKIHRLVAEHFIPNPTNSPEVNHIDGNLRNNRVENLQWCTRSENELHARRTGIKKGNYLGKLYKKLTGN